MTDTKPVLTRDRIIEFRATFSDLEGYDQETLRLLCDLALPVAAGTHCIVPIEPTEAMILAGDEHTSCYDDSVEYIYAAMIAERNKP